MTGSSSDNPSYPGFGSGDSDPGDEKRRQLVKAIRFWHLSTNEIWMHYFSLGGSVGQYEVDAYLNSSYSLSALQHDILAQAINELIDQLPPPPRAPYIDDAEVDPWLEKESQPDRSEGDAEGASGAERTEDSRRDEK